MERRYWCILLSLILSLTMGGLVAHVHAKGNNSAFDSNSDINAVWGLSQEAIEGTKKLTMKHMSYYKNYADLFEFTHLAEQFSEQFNLPRGKVIVDAVGHLIYKVDFIEPDGSNAVQSITLMGDRHLTYLIIERESVGEVKIDRAEDWHTQMNLLLGAIHVTPNWNIIVQGKLHVSKGTAVGDVINGLRNLLQKEMDVREMERYQDVRTYSMTYYSPKITKSVNSGDHSVNLQAAIHQVTGSDEWRLTLGTPVITTEY